MVVYGKIDFEAYKNKEDPYKNNIGQLYFIRWWSDLHLNFPSKPKDGSDKMCRNVGKKKSNNNWIDNSKNLF